MENVKKPRLLLVLKMLQKTDVNHPLNTTEIINKLKQCCVDAERKAVLRDLKALKTVGYKIIKCDNHNRGYYMETYLFEKHELKIIADLVADATFLTVQASTAILQKIWSLCSVSIAALLEEGSFINESNKVETESELEKISALLCAIAENKVVSFQMIMPRQFNGEAFYGSGHKKEVRPYYIFLDDGKYILLGHDEKSNELDCFEIALINKLMILDKTNASQINVWPGRKEYYLRWYMDRSQNLYSPSFETVTLLCDNIIQQEVKRKFGNESLFFERPFNKCMVIVDVTDQNDFFQWLLYMDSKAKILRTEELQMQFVEYVRRKYTDYLEQYRL
ncbi:putative DNA-binding transcriptional regulator YafY [Anaerobacterium chartisolvens]|uniref:Putative DNA-binding transcriptional regulator YafY n=1 Tax=Anaerobacterium chartisolvens TaxID=1297424 RepID=A0A369BGA5_9FIRM|nr:WYL domain-containing protein [Anaerobacterium chartisolvens]RCX19507.1 putative DNA-binding transcriptional regulator YafY [Anaerobacterium chartisolvens]